MENLSPITLSCVLAMLALAVAATLTPPVRSLARRIGAVDAPGVRRMHRQTVPRLGGLAIVVAYAAAFAFMTMSNAVSVSPSSQQRLLAFLVGALIIATTGVLDDLRGLGAKKKLAAQLLAASVAWGFKVRIHPVVEIPYLGLVDLGLLFSYVATVVWIVAITNAINLIDGLDGLAGGVVFFASATNVIVALVSDNLLGAALNAILSGAVLGFLFYNFRPAKIFMGDTGSLFLGYVLSAGALLTARQKESTLASLMVPMIALGLPLTDTLLAMARRMIARRSVFSPDREHVHHRLLDLGLTHGRVVLVLYAFSILLCGVSVAAALGKDWQVGAALFGAVFIVVGIVRLGGSLERALQNRRNRDYLYTEATASVGDRLPSYFAALVEIKGENHIFSALDMLLNESYFPAIRITVSDDQDPIWERLESGPQSRLEGSRQRLEYRLDSRSSSKLTLIYHSHSRGVPPQLDVLLRVAASALSEALSRNKATPPPKQGA